MTKCFKFQLILAFIIVICFSGSLWANWRTGLPHDPDWLVDQELGVGWSGWDKGYHKCMPPFGGYNKITENQKIINSWGYKARPMEEIKHLLPGPQYEMYNHPEIWGTTRINETDWEAAKPRGAMWKKFMAQTKRNKKEVYLDEKDWLRNYHYGIPFPDLDENDPKICQKLIWNFFKRYQDNDRVVAMDIITKDRTGHSRHNALLNRRLQYSGRTRGDDVTINGHYIPNPKNLEFVYATPFFAPYNLRGTIPLWYRYNDPDKDDDMWIYIPSIRRIRRMSTSQHQDRFPGGVDWTYDNTECWEGNVRRFNYTYLGRKELLSCVIGHSHSYCDQAGYLNANDQYYQRRNLYVVKATYKNPINMTDLELYLDPLLYTCAWSIDRDMKGRDWIVQIVTQGRDKHWFYTMYNVYAIDIQRRHSTCGQMSYSGSKNFREKDVMMPGLKKEFLSR